MSTGTKWGQRTERRADLLEAAREQLAAGGFAALNMRDVARAAGVSPGTVYTYFTGKEDLFATLYAQRLDELNTQLAPACERATSGEQLFELIATEYLDVYRVFGRELDVWAILLADNPAASELAKPLIRAALQVLDTVQAATRRIYGPAALPQDPEQERLALLFVWATITGLAEHYTGGRRKLHGFGWEQLVGFAARTVVAGLAATRQERGQP